MQFPRAGGVLLEEPVFIRFQESSEEQLRKQVNLTLNQKKATGQRSTLSCVPSSDGSQLYFLGVIDILQEWNAPKQVERYETVFWIPVAESFRCFKVGMRCEDGEGISAIDPDRYAARFIKSMKDVIQ